MDADRHWQMRLRLLEDREQQLLQGLEAMSPDEMRWSVRLLADGLTHERWQAALAGYHEYLPAEQVRAFLQEFIPLCTQLSVLDLHAKRELEPDSLPSLTDADLQGMSAREKWELIARAPRSLDPERTARELARLALCLQPDLLLDALLPRAVIEFPVYFRLKEALGRLPSSEIYALSDKAAADVPSLNDLPPAEATARLAALRQDIARAAGFTEPLEGMLGASMDLLPKEFFPPGTRTGIPQSRLTEALGELEGSSPEDLCRTLQILADQLSLRETQDLLGPYRAEYPSPHRMPAEVLRRLVATLAVHLDGRTPCDFIHRYRTGRLLALAPLTGEVWNLMPQTDRLRLLERDNAAMDLPQTARHLARLLLSRKYQMLDDPESQKSIGLSPLYQDVMHRLLGLPDQDGEPGILGLNRAVTRLTLEMEQSPREERAERLEEIRRRIGRAVGLSPRERPASLDGRDPRLVS
ncbi:MAG TPA: hypothetical protein VLH58_05435 [Candidatus Methylomirabilis sp.]|nr:hypothetical protein [Candidatus Methylomirabilis sp.]HSC70773.1 hypothetical protein [Candidatus Methylomirabilis sp.]